MCPGTITDLVRGAGSSSQLASTVFAVDYSMAGIRWPPEDSDLVQTRASTGADLMSDDDRSVAADSWSIKSDYGSTLDDEQRHMDASELLSTGTVRAASDYSSEKDEPDAEIEPSMLGLQSYWNSAYADELANFREHGHVGEIWFGVEVMEAISVWTKDLCLRVSLSHDPKHHNNSYGSETFKDDNKSLCTWSVLDVGTGNGLLLQELAKQGFSDLTGIDYSEAAITLARSLAVRDGFPCINFLVDDILEPKLERSYKLVLDKGTLDAVGLHPDGPVKRIMYWDSISKLLAPGGMLVLTSCNNTRDELVQEVESFNQRRRSMQGSGSPGEDQNLAREPFLRYLSHVQSYPHFMFGGVIGSRVATVAFVRNSA